MPKLKGNVKQGIHMNQEFRGAAGRELTPLLLLHIRPSEYTPERKYGRATASDTEKREEGSICK